MFYKTSRTFFIFLFIFSNICLAEGLLEDDFFSGFSGRIELSFYSIVTNSNLLPLNKDEYDYVNEENSKNDELKKNNKYYIAANTSIAFNVEYAFESGTVAYVGTHFYDDSREGVVFGVEKELPSFILDISSFVDFNDVWEDPYLTTEKTLTSEFISGVEISFNRILNSRVNIGIKSKFKYIEDDISGDTYEDLQRNGFVHTLNIEYDHIFDKTKNPNNLVFKTSCNYADMDGESNSYRSILLGIKGTYWYEEISISLSSIYEGRRYEKIHPIFNETREDDICTNGIYVTFHNLGKSNKWYITGLISVSNTFSNIDFYSSDNYLVLSSLGYNF